MNEYEQLVNETKQVLDRLYNTKDKEEYEQLIINHLETLSKNRVMKLRTNGNKYFWKGEIFSMIDAYLFLKKIPSVSPANITYHFASDCLIYNAKINKKLQLIMHEKYVRGNRMVDLELNGCKEPISVRLLFKNI